MLLFHNNNYCWSRRCPGPYIFLCFTPCSCMSPQKPSILLHKSMSAQTFFFCCEPFSYDSSINPAQSFLAKMKIFHFSLLHHVSLVSGLILAPLGLSWGAGWLPGRLGGLRWTLLNHCKYHQSRAGASILHHVLLCYTLAPLGDPSKPL